MTARIAQLRQLVLDDVAKRALDGPLHVVFDGSLVGRSNVCDVKVDDDAVSRRHARIEWQDGRPIVRDLGSHNGTFIGNTRVMDTAPLRTGDLLKIGRTLLRFSGEAPAGGPLPPAPAGGAPDGGAAPAQAGAWPPSALERDRSHN